MSSARPRVEVLREELRCHEHLYYVLDQPELPDSDYDRLFRELQALEAAHPEWVTPDSPTMRVGGKPREGVATAAHSSPMLSLDNALNQDIISSNKIVCCISRFTGGYRRCHRWGFRL